MRKHGPPRSPVWLRWRCSTPSGCSTTTAASKSRRQCRKSCSTKRGVARTSSKRRSLGSRSDRRNSRGLNRMLRAALRLAAGTVSLATGGWVLRALHGAPAALGAQPSEIRGVAERSPNFHDGVFVNLEPPSMNIDAEQGRSLLWEIITGLEDAKPSAEIPLDTPEPRA